MRILFLSRFVLCSVGEIPFAETVLSVCQERQERQHERTSLKESARRGADQFGYKSKGRHVRRELRTELRTEKEEDAKNSR